MTVSQFACGSLVPLGDLAGVIKAHALGLNAVREVGAHASTVQRENVPAAGACGHKVRS
jgi:hypothetical protein